MYFIIEISSLVIGPSLGVEQPGGSVSLLFLLSYAVMS